MMNLHNVEIAKTPHGEKILLDGKELKGLKDFTVIRKANNVAVLQLELFVGDVTAVNKSANNDAVKFKEWADEFNKKCSVSLVVNGNEVFDAVKRGYERAYNCGAVK